MDKKITSEFEKMLGKTQREKKKGISKEECQTDAELRSGASAKHRCDQDTEHDKKLAHDWIAKQEKSIGQ